MPIPLAPYMAVSLPQKVTVTGTPAPSSLVNDRKYLRFYLWIGNLFYRFIFKAIAYKLWQRCHYCQERYARKDAASVTRWHSEQPRTNVLFWEETFSFLVSISGGLSYPVLQTWDEKSKYCVLLLQTFVCILKIMRLQQIVAQAKMYRNFHMNS